MEHNELKPCPFCGGAAEIQVIEKGVKSIICCTTPQCGFMRHSFNNGDTDENTALRLTTAWNRRAENERN
jgi:Lar family restriction alleviation protein